MLTTSDIIEEMVHIPSTRGVLEAMLAYPTHPVQLGAIIAGPHPLLGGDMRNNVVLALARGLAQNGVVNLSFNYSGVGRSDGGPSDWPAAMSAFWRDGHIPTEEDWIEDTGTAIDALGNWHPHDLVLIGYSFGCRAIIHHAGQPAARMMILISPNPAHCPTDGLSRSSVPLLVIHSDNDFTCDANAMGAWFGNIREPRGRLQIAAGEHFFRGSEPALVDAVASFINGNPPPPGD